MDRPILFKDEMVRAILEGRKTQTRRVMKPQPRIESNGWFHWDGHRPNSEYGAFATSIPEKETINIFVGSSCPHGQVGDRLWVREKFATHFIWDDLPPGHIDIQNHSDGFFYGDGAITSLGCEDHQRGKWRPSIHMPRFASRITLEITGVRVERLQDISEEDAIAEGARHFPDLPGTSPYGQDDRWSMETPDSCDKCLGNARMAFANYFCKITGNAPKGLHDPRPWDANPWVWVIEFRRVD